ncbi:hypothetical protein D3C79_984640 [compost metagenome]
MKASARSLICIVVTPGRMKVSRSANTWASKRPALRIRSSWAGVLRITWDMWVQNSSEAESFQHSAMGRPAAT